jgi:hybrid cluster-associated redox disulfide protein
MSDEAMVITKKSTIGEIFSKHPETEPVFQKYFGSGCFTCPGSKTEDIAFGAMMHNIEPEKIIEELNEAIKKKAEGGE